MSPRNTRRKKKASVAGWTKWLPVVALPLSALFFETWLNTEQIKKDYRMAALMQRTQKARKELNELNARIAEMNPQQLLERKAQELGLVLPEPNQIRVIYYGNAPDEATRAEPTPLESDLLTIRPQEPAPMDDAPAVKEVPCTTPTATSPKRLAAAMQRLRQAIAGAYATCFGHS